MHPFGQPELHQLNEYPKSLEVLVHDALEFELGSTHRKLLGLTLHHEEVQPVRRMRSQDEQLRALRQRQDAYLIGHCCELEMVARQDYQSPRHKDEYEILQTQQD